MSTDPDVRATIEEDIPTRKDDRKESKFQAVYGFVLVLLFIAVVVVLGVLIMMRMSRLEAELKELKAAMRQLKTAKSNVSAKGFRTNDTQGKFANSEHSDSDYIDPELTNIENDVEYEYYYNEANDTYTNETNAQNVSVTESPTVEDKLKPVQLGNVSEQTLNIKKEETVTNSPSEKSNQNFNGHPTVAGSGKIDTKMYFKHIKSEDHVVQKRSVIASTHDGVPINSEPYLQREHKTKTAGLDKFYGKGYTVTSAPARPSAFGSPWTTQPGTDFGFSQNINPFTTPRPDIRHLNLLNDHRRTGNNFKSAALEVDPEENSDSNLDFTVVRKPSHEPRSSNIEVLDENHFHYRRIKPLPATHYNGDTSKYVLGQHTNFNGNGHLRHPQRTFVDWAASNWVQSTGMGSYFSMDNGIVSIKENGLYFIYAQIYYLDEHDMVGYRVYRNGDIILQCTITHHSSTRKLKGNTCFTAGVEYLSEGDAVSLADITEGKYSLFEPGKSFFGMIRIGDVKVK